MIEYLIQNPATVAAFFSLVTAVFASWATWKGPQKAAVIAEQLRQQSEAAHERRRMKLQIFSTLMQERANIASIDSVRMLNSIDFVFFDCPEVREAWAELYKIYETNDVPHHQLSEDKLRRLLREMAKDVGLHDKLKTDDLSRIYFPNALAREEQIKRLQQEEALLRIQTRDGQTIPAIDFGKKFPPKPSQN